MELHFDIGGAATVGVSGSEGPWVERLRAVMRPWDAADGADPDVGITLVDHDPPAPQELIGDTGDGLRLGARPGRAQVLIDDAWWSIPDGGDLHGLEASARLRPSRLATDVIRPAVMIHVGRTGGATLHASTVVDGDGPLILAGWSEAGKTETALAFVEDGATLLSDKWTVLRADGGLVRLPGAVYIRGWVLEYLGTLRDGLTMRMRGQRLAARAARLAPWAARRLPGDAARDLADRLDVIAELGDRLRLDPETIAAISGRPAIGKSGPATRLILLRTRPDASIEVADCRPDEVIDALIASSSFERRSTTDLAVRASYARPPLDLRSLDVRTEERAALTKLLAPVRVMEVHAPFPTDPRRVRDAILAHR
jgi:hypothetical protein